MDRVVEEEFELGVSSFAFADLYDPCRLRDLHREFWAFASSRDPLLAGRFATLSDLNLPRPEQ